MMHCPLCHNEVFSREVSGPNDQWFYHCKKCQLVFSGKQDLPSHNDEKERYLEHENSILDEGYVGHLNQAINPALPYLNTKMRGLDYGCGPVPTLHKLLEQKNLNCEFYDPIFFPEAPLGKFDFIFATECFEHFFGPDNELHKLVNLMNPEGLLIIMTKLWKNIEKFKSWKYAQDPTHVVFYHKQTIDWICKSYGFKMLEIRKSQVIILQKINGIN